MGGVVGQGRIPTGLHLSDPKVSEVAEEGSVEQPPNETSSSSKHFDESDASPPPQPERKVWSKGAIVLEKEVSMSDVLGDVKTFS